MYVRMYVYIHIRIYIHTYLRTHILYKYTPMITSNRIRIYGVVGPMARPRRPSSHLPLPLPKKKRAKAQAPQLKVNQERLRVVRGDSVYIFVYVCI